MKQWQVWSHLSQICYKSAQVWGQVQGLNGRVNAVSMQVRCTKTQTWQKLIGCAIAMMFLVKSLDHSQQSVLSSFVHNDFFNFLCLGADPGYPHIQISADVQCQLNSCCLFMHMMRLTLACVPLSLAVQCTRATEDMWCCGRHLRANFTQNVNPKSIKAIRIEATGKVDHCSSEWLDNPKETYMLLMPHTLRLSFWLKETHVSIETLIIA